MNVIHQFISACVLVLLCSILSVPAFAQERVIITATDTTLFNTQPDEEEFRLLSEFYKQLNGKKWKKNTSWLKGKTNADMARWYGVVVRDGDISEIHLPDNNLRGAIPKSIYKLKALKALSLENNALEEPKKAYQKTQIASSSSNGNVMDAAVLSKAPIVVGKNLPVWGLAVAGPTAQQVDWRVTPPAVDPLVNSGVSQHGASGVAIDNCGKIAFYVLHSGTDAVNQLHIHRADGTKLTNNIAGNPLQALNSAAGVNELQVVRVPGTADEWYLIYSKWQTPCNGPPYSSAYCPAKVVYSRVKYNAIDGLTILPGKREVQIGNANHTFIHGKAVSRTVNGDASRHFLYLAQRGITEPYSINNNLTLHRFIIDADRIDYPVQSPALVPAEFWNAGISGSSLELSPDETKLAISNRNIYSTNKQEIIIFDVTQFTSSTYNPIVISAAGLVVYGTGKTVFQLQDQYPCLANLEHKLSYIEFSPSGRYLYAVHGGYPGAGNKPYNTYLLQIDLQSGSGEGDYEIRMQIEKGYAAASSCNGAYGTLPGNTMIGQIQTAYDGKLYFTKGSSSTLFVIPNPDDPLPHSLVPGVVNLATATSPNIEMDNAAGVSYMPENIDGYDYLKESMIEKFVLNKTTAGKGEAVLLTIQSFVPADGNSYQVSWGDGIVESLTAASKTHSYEEAGDYRITLTVISSDKCALITSKIVNIVDCAQAIIEIGHTPYLCAIKFSVPKVTDCYATYDWNFGDGQHSANRSPMHVYGIPGTYTASVTISYDCSGCADIVTATKPITVADQGPVFEEQEIQVPSDQKIRVLSSSATSFSDAWPLDHNETALENLNSFNGGSEGMWRNEGSFVYNTPRSASSPVAIGSDGTYTLEHFNWAHAELEAIPKWTKTNSMTRYNAYSFELENKDVLDVHSGALYDYNGQLQSAHGVNMRNEEMGFTSFEHFNGKPTGNFIFSNTPLPAFTTYKVRTANAYVAVVEASLEELVDAERADIKMAAQKGSLFVLVKKSRYLKNVKIMCKEVYPDNPAWSVLVFEVAPYHGTWSGEITIKNVVVPAVQATLDNTIAHCGKTSMRIEAEKVFEQKLIRLEAGKTYHVNAWVAVQNPNLHTPKLSNGLGIDVIMKNRDGVIVSLTSVLAEGKVIEGWQQVKGSFTCPEKDLVLSLRFKPGSTGKAWYDDIRVHPESGNLKSYVYNITDYRLNAILDEDNFATFFYYDKEGNLYLTKKETEDGIKTITENITYQVER
jgi:PKD repeat protein